LVPARLGGLCQEPVANGVGVRIGAQPDFGDPGIGANAPQHRELSRIVIPVGDSRIELYFWLVDAVFSG
jgi:hypothetical protein